jgi:hypothetical protein
VLGVAMRRDLGRQTVLQLSVGVVGVPEPMKPNVAEPPAGREPL